MGLNKLIAQLRGMIDFFDPLDLDPKYVGLLQALAIAHLARSLTPSTAAEPRIETVEYGSDLDSKGIKWDGNIHSSTRVRNADGTWRIKRGTGPIANS